MVNSYKKLITSAIIGASITTFSGAAMADSLYAPVPGAGVAAGAPINYFNDPKAHAVGDIVTVVVTETASGNSTGTTTGDSTANATFGPGTGTVLSLIKTLGLSGSETSKADGGTSRTDTLTATISCTVTSVLPNGNLVIEGSRAVGVNSETQTMTLTGVIRPMDISETNEVQSPQVADAKIKYSGKGTVSEVQHDGLVRQIFKYLF